MQSIFKILKWNVESVGGELKKNKINVLIKCQEVCRLTPPLSFHSLLFLFPPQRPFSPPLSLPSAPDSNSRERPSLEMGYRKHRSHCAGPPGLPATGPSQLPPHSIPSGTRSCHFSAQTQGAASNSPLNTSW